MGGWRCLCGVGTRGSCVCVCVRVCVGRDDDGCGGEGWWAGVWWWCVVAVVGGYVGDGAVVVMVCEHGWVCEWLMGSW